MILEPKYCKYYREAHQRNALKTHSLLLLLCIECAPILVYHSNRGKAVGILVSISFLS